MVVKGAHKLALLLPASHRLPPLRAFRLRPNATSYQLSGFRNQFLHFVGFVDNCKNMERR